MKIERININKLKPAEYNPRQISKRDFNILTDSLLKFGCVDPIIINLDKTIIGGHQRVKAFKTLAEQGKLEDITIPCVVLNLTKEQEKELNIRLNQNGGEWDFDLLSNFEIEELKDWGFKEIELGLNIDKIEEKKDDSYIVSVKTKDALEAEKIHLELKEQGYNVTLRKSV